MERRGEERERRGEGRQKRREKKQRRYEEDHFRKHRGPYSEPPCHGDDYPISFPSKGATPHKITMSVSSVKKEELNDMLT